MFVLGHKSSLGSLSPEHRGDKASGSVSGTGDRISAMFRRVLRGGRIGEAEASLDGGPGVRLEKAAD